jgi:hypothetical protein
MRMVQRKRGSSIFPKYESCLRDCSADLVRLCALAQYFRGMHVLAGRNVRSSAMPDVPRGRAPGDAGSVRYRRP